MLFIILTGPKCLFLLWGIKCMFITVLPTLRWAPHINSDQKNQAHRLVKNDFVFFLVFCLVFFVLCEIFCMHYNLCFSSAWYSISICTIISLMAILPFANVLNHSWMHLFFLFCERDFLLLNNSLFPCSMLISRNLFLIQFELRRKEVCLLFLQCRIPFDCQLCDMARCSWTQPLFRWCWLLIEDALCSFFAPGEVCCWRDDVKVLTGACHSLYKKRIKLAFLFFVCFFASDRNWNSDQCVALKSQYHQV